ncbi:ABC transporter permease [Nocardioides yefusunii]|uniref:ABC transporter permease n=1 Tax=Nocardioides yefusunii TaxID=2500546 RepID=A0ABW1R267_9ACTN|nr:ABC transporter permease [Nocardioides yefusunii]
MGLVKGGGIPLRMLLAEGLAGILQRPGRSALTTLGTLLGVGSFVAVLGITGSADGQISKRFDALSATEVSVESNGVADPVSGRVSSEFPSGTEEQVARINGVVGAGRLWDLGASVRVGARAPGSGVPAQSGAISVTAASPGLWDVVRPQVEGRVFDEALAEHDVAVVGRSIHRQLALGPLETAPAVFVDDVPFTVIGIVDDAERLTDSLLSVIVPADRVTARWGEPAGTDRMLVETSLGAAAQVAEQVPVALRPDHPTALRATAPLDPRKLRETVSGDLDALFVALAGICLFIGAVGIANTTLVAVLERIPEIGLRRALGASPAQVGTQFLLESILLGTFGGLLGTMLGTLVTLTVALARDWTALLSPWIVMGAPVLGALAGLLAGVYPALRAARIEPVEAFRRD